MQLINRITGAANLKVANKTEAIERIFELVVGEEETIEFEELLVRRAGRVPGLVC